MANVAIARASCEANAQFDQPNGDVLDPNTLTARSKDKVTFAVGTGDLAANRCVSMKLPIVLSGTMSLNLLLGTYTDGTNTGNLVDKNGATVTLSKVKYIKVVLLDEVGGPVQLHFNAGATNPAVTLAGKIKAKGNGAGWSGYFAWCDPTGETIDATHKIIELVNDSALAGHFEIVIFGSV